MNRRSLLGMLGVGMGMAVVSPAWAQRIRILPGSGDAASAAGGGTVANDVRRDLEGVRVGDRRSHGGLTVFWLGAPAAPAPFPIATLDEALAKGGFFVTERDQAAVSTLVVENRGPVHVLLLAGEILQGGKQNRIVVTPSPGSTSFRTIRCSLVSGRSCSAPARSTHTVAGSPTRRRRGRGLRSTRS